MRVRKLAPSAGLIVCLAAVFLYPYESTAVPEWRIRVVDEASNPIGNVRVNEEWRHYSVEWHSRSQELSTDENGYVIFPRRVARGNLVVRGILAGMNLMNAHGRSGPYAWLVVSGPYSSQSNTEYSPGNPLVPIVVVRPIGRNQ